MSEKVACYSGSVYPERPTALYWRGQRLEVEKVLQAWHIPQGRRFRVQTTDYQVFELVYQQAEDDWLISQGTGT
jgi:hypothetical protein